VPPACRRRAGKTRIFVESGGHLLFTRHDYPLHLSDIAFVKVGAVSGADEVYTSDSYGNRDFRLFDHRPDGKTRRMIWCEPGDSPPRSAASAQGSPDRPPHPQIRRIELVAMGARLLPVDLPRVYVNNKTRRQNPFFVHDCPHYDGSVLAIFPNDPTIDVACAGRRAQCGRLGRPRFRLRRPLSCSPSAALNKRPCPRSFVPFFRKGNKAGGIN
jgi:adenine-specific DNA-methyltransferase